MPTAKQLYVSPQLTRSERITIHELDTSKIRPGDELPHAFFALSQILFNKGWMVSVKTDTHIDHCTRARISASRHGWIGMPTPSYSFAFLSPSNTQADVTDALRKLTALCLTMETIFHDTLPTASVDNSGVIRTDERMTKVAQSGASALLHYAIERPANKQRNNGLYIERGFLHWQWDAQNILIRQIEIDALEGLLDE
jgi:hypothetical protein